MPSPLESELGELRSRLERPRADKEVLRGLRSFEVLFRSFSRSNHLQNSADLACTHAILMNYLFMIALGERRGRGLRDGRGGVSRERERRSRTRRKEGGFEQGGRIDEALGGVR